MNDSLIYSGISSSCDSLLNNHEFLTESIFDEKSSVYFNHQEQLELKSQAISSALKDEDLSILTKLGISRGGFVNHSLRRSCWRRILSTSMQIESDCDYDVSLEPHKDEHQVSLDVKRSFGGIKDIQKKETLRQILERTIVRLLRKYRQLNYYQGYHDVVAIFILVFLEEHGNEEDLSTSDLTSRDSDSSDHENLSNSSTSTKMSDDFSIEVDEDGLFRVLEVFTLIHLRDFLMNSLDFALDQLNVIPLLIKNRDSAFYKKFQLDSVEPFFAISSILTIFSHDLKSRNSPDDLIFQIFDMVISSQSMTVPLIIYSHLLLENKRMLIEKYNDSIDNFENATDLVHGVFQQVMLCEQDPKVWSEVLDKTRIAIEDTPHNMPQLLNRFSVILTTSKPRAIPFTTQEVLTFLTQEVELNEKRKLEGLEKRKVKSRRKNSRSKSLVSRLQQVISLGGLSFLKVSIIIGIIAILFKVYAQLPHQSISFPIGPYLEKFKALYGPGLNQSRKYWIDPLKSLLNAPPTSPHL